jgi:hypothetical protein
LNNGNPPSLDTSSSGSAMTAKFLIIKGLNIDYSNNIYVLDHSGTVRVITMDGMVSRPFSTFKNETSLNAITIDTSGFLYASTPSQKIFKIIMKSSPPSPPSPSPLPPPSPSPPPSPLPSPPPSPSPSLPPSPPPKPPPSPPPSPSPKPPPPRPKPPSPKPPSPKPPSPKPPSPKPPSPKPPSPKLPSPKPKNG